MMAPSIWTEDFFDDFMRDFPFYDDRDMKRMEKKLYGRHGKNVMKTDIQETDKNYILEMDLPGFSKDEVKVSLENGFLTISAAKGLNKDEKEKKNGRYIRRERYAGACQRSFYVGENISQDDISAEFKHGILKLSIPKKEPAEEKTYITID
ncbi:MAG TPA: Hsp20/alpha crystallin family protein [Candidatus Blautia intestinavium]|nr:Hsp20/alpha crystallin family protein [Candidatus Blautia intestinavium]